MTEPLRITINNPVPEPVSETLPKLLDRLRDDEPCQDDERDEP